MTDRDFLRGRRALVTGSSGGLGKWMAASLAAGGADVMLTDVQPAGGLDETCREVAGHHDVRVGYTSADLSACAGVEALVAETVEQLGGIDILINNAVVRHFTPIEHLAAGEWDRSVAVNLSAPFHATRLALPLMRANGYGRIINMTSVFATRATLNRVDYIATKAGVEGLTRATALESAGSGVSCHGLCPGSVLTPPNARRIDQIQEQEALSREEAEARFLEGKQPSGRFVSPDSITAVLMMLCGPAGLDINGAILPIEAGWLVKS
jgi:3-hydroxybutyrate dehydrogenase